MCSDLRSIGARDSQAPTSFFIIIIVIVIAIAIAIAIAPSPLCLH